MTDFKDPAKKGWFKKYFGQTSGYEEVCDYLGENKHWPFDDYGPFFELEFVNPKFYRAAVWLFVKFVFLASCMISFLVSSPGSYDFYFIPFLIIPSSMYHNILNIICYWNERQLCIRKLESWYEFKIGEDVIHEGDLSDLYIRLEALNCTNNKTYYQLVLNGYMVEKYILTSLTMKQDALDRIGRMIARRINLNYFDCSDISNKNVIRHVEARVVNKVEEERQQRLISMQKRISMKGSALGFF